MKVVYLTDGRTRTVQIGKRQVTLKHTTPRNMATAGKISGLVIQALRHIGQKTSTGGLPTGLRACSTRIRARN